ncbi:hypothetical protein AVEN_224048-1 [Araneus ventricosus]|uniref:Uncharacterized protein n=1 Tax=Araneus ventricosus TaxID=182803 RepID=A0A4Y2TNT8_ARAVE|nr:hypothetical protein AVEN_224048-1 [Araneus ventricosus]
MESCLNSSPFFPVSSDPDDLSVITLANFLIGWTLGAIPESTIHEVYSMELSFEPGTLRSQRRDLTARPPWPQHTAG